VARVAQAGAPRGAPGTARSGQYAVTQRQGHPFGTTQRALIGVISHVGYSLCCCERGCMSLLHCQRFPRAYSRLCTLASRGSRIAVCTVLAELPCVLSEFVAMSERLD